MVVYVWVTLVMDWQLIPIPLPLTQYQVGSTSSPLQPHLDKCKKRMDEVITLILLKMNNKY